MLHLDRTEIAARLPRRALIERLERAFATDSGTPVRQRHDLGGEGAGQITIGHARMAREWRHRRGSS